MPRRENMANRKTEKKIVAMISRTICFLSLTGSKIKIVIPVNNMEELKKPTRGIAKIQSAAINERMMPRLICPEFRGNTVAWSRSFCHFTPEITMLAADKAMPVTQINLGQRAAAGWS